MPFISFLVNLLCIKWYLVRVFVFIFLIIDDMSSSSCLYWLLIFSLLWNTITSLARSFMGHFWHNIRFASLFLILIQFISFSCVVINGISVTMLNSRSDSGYPSLFLILKAILLIFHHNSDVCSKFWLLFFITLRMFPPIPSSLRLFITDGGRISPNASSSSEMIIWILSFHLARQWNILMGF